MTNQKGGRGFADGFRQIPLDQMPQRKTVPHWGELSLISRLRISLECAVIDYVMYGLVFHTSHVG